MAHSAPPSCPVNSGHRVGVITKIGDQSQCLLDRLDLPTHHKRRFERVHHVSRAAAGAWDRSCHQRTATGASLMSEPLPVLCGSAA